MPFLTDLLGLCKLKVVALILLTALVGMLLSVPYLPPLLLVLAGLIGIGLAAASAAVFNHIVDEKIDTQMKRTSQRPLPRGKVSRSWALVWGVFLGITGLSILYFWVNTLTAVLTFAALIGYALIYTLYLKHATPQNIVIGGAAGAAPPILGWSTITNDVSAHSLLLFLIIFIWTPPHFWALAIYRFEEYKKVGVPMLPVTHGIPYTRMQILLYTILLFLVTLLPYLLTMSGVIYLICAIVLGVIFLIYAIKIYQQPNNPKIAFATFLYSINYLMLLFGALLIDHYLLLPLGGF